MQLRAGVGAHQECRIVVGGSVFLSFFFLFDFGPVAQSCVRTWRLDCEGDEGRAAKWGNDRQFSLWLIFAFLWSGGTISSRASLSSSNC